MEKEVRAITGLVALETRADGKEYITGQAIVYNQLSQLLGGWFKEQIDPRALDGCDMTDTTGLFNHDDDMILGRITAGTLTLEARADGLWYAIPYDANDPDHMRVRAKIMRGDIRGSSFGFVIAPGGADWDTDPVTGTEIRTVKKIAILADVSPVTNPAYLQTSAGLSKRSLDEIKQEFEQYQQEKRGKAIVDKIVPVTETAHSEVLTRDETLQVDEATTQVQQIPDNTVAIAAEHDAMAMELDL